VIARAQESAAMNSYDQTAGIADALAERGFAIVPDWLPPDQVAALAEEAQALSAGGRFKHAGVGRGAGHAVRREIRGDSILWLDEQAPTAAQAAYWAAIEALRAALNRELYLGLASFEAHYAIYPPGTHYQKHVDRFSDADERVISCSLYLNREWREQHGGQLRLHLADGHPDGYIDVLPTAGTCVLFRSDTFLHEVLPATRTRLSVFRRRPSGPVPA
jgi:SM-20-related protein